MAFLSTVTENSDFRDGQYVDGNNTTQCVTFVQKTTAVSNTQNWRAGRKVLDAGYGEIRKYTAIATFDNMGKYPTDIKGKHAAIYLSHNTMTKEIIVLDQYAGKTKVTPRTIHLAVDKTGPHYKRSNDSDTYYVIE